jgi:hypothetical protein
MNWARCQTQVTDRAQGGKRHTEESFASRIVNKLRSRSRSCQTTSSISESLGDALSRCAANDHCGRREIECVE